MNIHTTSKLARLALFAATLIWGSSFFIIKNTLGSIPVFYLLAIRFVASAAILSIIFHKSLRQMNRDYAIRGSILGALLFFAYAFQTYGVMRTTPGKNAFLTAAYCVMVPFLHWAYRRVRPDRYNVCASVLCIAGIAFVSINEGFSVNIGDMLTLVCSVFYALHIVAVADFSKGRDIFLLTVIQFASTGTLNLAAGLIFEEFPRSVPPGAVYSMLYLTVLCTSVALLLQNVGQKYTPPSTAAIILSLESVFGVIFSMVFYGERLSLKVALGFSMIFISVIVSETKLSFLKSTALSSGFENQDA